jgi:hypothetical protein
MVNEQNNSRAIDLGTDTGELPDILAIPSLIDSGPLLPFTVMLDLYEVSDGIRWYQVSAPNATEAAIAAAQAYGGLTRAQAIYYLDHDSYVMSLIPGHVQPTHYAPPPALRGAAYLEHELSALRTVIEKNTTLTAELKTVLLEQGIAAATERLHPIRNRWRVVHDRLEAANAADDEAQKAVKEAATRNGVPPRGLWPPPGHGPVFVPTLIHGY